MKFVLLSIVTLLFPSIGLSQTLCKKNEIDYFSCKTTAREKILSICGNIKNSEINSDNWLQYRFGKLRAIELVYPEEKQGSVTKFEGNYFNKYGAIDLRFINSKALYSVSLYDTYSGSDGKERTSPSGGVSVQMVSDKSVNISCQKVDTRKYFEIFSLLNDSLRSNNGETDFLYQFYNHVSK